MRVNRVGEIYYIMKESRKDENFEHSEEFSYIINNYLLLFYLEDHNADELVDDLKSRQQQIHKYYQKQFKLLVDPIREADDPPLEFRKLFPPPVPPRGQDKTYKQLYQKYQEWV